MKSSLLFSALLGASAHAAEVLPGNPWYDTDDNQIQAHGGGLVVEGDTYYLIGENKTAREGNESGAHFNSVSVSFFMALFQMFESPEGFVCADEIWMMSVVLSVHKPGGLGVCARPPLPRHLDP